MNWGWEIGCHCSIHAWPLFSMNSASAGGRLRPVGAGRDVTAGA